MSRTELVLVVPPDYDGRVDTAIDRVVEDPDATTPKVRQEKVPEDGETSVDRAFVTDARKKQVADAIAAYEAETAKTSPDPQVQVAELEKAISYMWDVVSGEDVGAEATREAAQSE